MSDILFTRRAAASFLNIKSAGLRMAIRRGYLREESLRLIPLDELEKYLHNHQRKRPRKYTPPPEGICEQCGQLSKTRLCKWCQKELETGRYIWYTM